MAATLTKEETENHCKQVNDLQVKALLNILVDMREEMDAKRLSKTLSYVYTNAIYNYLPTTIVKAYA